MKQKDIALIIVVVFVSAVFSLVISNYVFTTSPNRRQKVEVVDKIDANFTEPDKKYFNDNSIDPTQVIKIGDTANNNPFNSSQK